MNKSKRELNKLKSALNLHIPLHNRPLPLGPVELSADGRKSMSARVIKNEILEFKEEFLNIKENLSFRLFLSLSLGSLFLMGCEEKLAQEPKQAPATVVDLVTPEQQREATEVARQEAGFAREHEAQLKGMEIEADRYRSDQAAETARFEADSETARAQIESNGDVAAAQVEADSAMNEAMMGGLFGVATVGLEQYMKGQIQEKAAEANLRAAEAGEVAARIQAEAYAKSIDYQRDLENRRLDIFTDREKRIEDYLCGGRNEAQAGPCGTEEGSWKRAMDNALAQLQTDLAAAAEAELAGPGGTTREIENFREQKKQAAIATFVEAFNGLPAQTYPSQDVHDNTRRAINGFLGRVKRGENTRFDLQDIYRADMEAENNRLSRGLGMSSATRETGGIDDNFHAAYRPGVTPKTDTANLRDGN